MLIVGFQKNVVVFYNNSMAFLLKCTIIKYSSHLRGHASFLQVKTGEILRKTSVPYPLLACRDESEVVAPQ